MPLVLLLTAFLLAPAASAQVKVTAISVGGKGVQRTASVKYVRYGMPSKPPVELPEVAVGLSLSPGDQLYSVADGVVVEVVCGKAARMPLSNSFRIVVLPPPGPEHCCRILLLSGTAYSQGTEPTTITSGEIILGSKHTQYGIQVSRDAGGRLDRTVFVYEGEVEVLSPQFRGSLTTGKQVAIDSAEPNVVEISREEIAATATIYAQVEVAKADLASGGQLTNRDSLFARLKELNEKVLADPKNLDYRTELARTQSSIQLTNEARYHFDMALALAPADNYVAFLREINAAGGKDASVSYAARQGEFISVSRKESVLDAVVVDPEILRALKNRKTAWNSIKATVPRNPR